MGKKIKILIFSKMSLTILTKFCGFIVHLKPNNKIISAFLGKIPETGKIFFQSPKVGPKLNDQSRSNSITRVPLQISLALSSFSIYPQN